MKTAKLMSICAMALLTTIACTNKEDAPTEADYAAQASISSNNPSFTSDANGGSITFKASGGDVVVLVDCQVDWTAVVDSGSDWVSAVVDLNAETLTVSTEQSTVEEEQTAVIYLETAESGIQFATINITQNAYNTPEISTDVYSWHAPAVGTLTTSVTVISTDDWDYSYDTSAEWLTIEKTDTGLDLTAAENEDPAERSVELTLTCTDGVMSDNTTFTVTQDGRAYISLSAETLSFEAEGGSATISVESNYDLSYSVSGDWFGVSISENTLTVTAPEYEVEESREGTIVFTAGDGAENIAEAIITVFQAAYVRPSLILTYTTSSASTEIMLPLENNGDSTIDCTVDWGDGSDVETVTSAVPTHIYATAGEYDVTIDGKVPEISTYDSHTNTSTQNYLTAIKSWGDVGLETLKYGFYKCTKLASLPERTGKGLSGVTSFSDAFGYCSSLTSVPADLFPYSSEATTLQYVFEYCSGLTELPAGLFTGCTAVTVASYSFTSCTKLESLPERMFAGLSNLSDVQYAFQSCTAIKSISADMFEGCTGITNMKCTFYKCSALTSIPAGLFDDCINNTTFYETFQGCSLLTSIPQGLFDHSTKVNTFYQTFYQDYALTTIPEKLFSKCAKAVTMQKTFYQCTALTELPAGTFANCGCDTTKVTFAQICYGCTNLETIAADIFAGCTTTTTLSAIFQNCSMLRTIPEGLFDDCVANTTYANAFNGCSLVASIPENLFAGSKLVTSFSSTFKGCTSLSGYSAYDLVDGTKIFLYDRSSHTDIYTAPSTTTSCYNGCTGLTDYSDIPSDWK